jgi:hypothetical protein
MLVKVFDYLRFVRVFTMESTPDISPAGAVFAVFTILAFHHRKSLRFLFPRDIPRH